MIDAPLQLIFALGLALLFASAGIHKLRNGPRFTAALAEYHLLPERWTPLIARALALLEILLAAALLLPLSRPDAGGLAAALLMLYAGAMTINLVRGRSYIDCGCGDRPEELLENASILREWSELRD